MATDAYRHTLMSVLSSLRLAHHAHREDAVGRSPSERPNVQQRLCYAKAWNIDLVGRRATRQNGTAQPRSTTRLARR